MKHIDGEEGAGPGTVVGVAGMMGAGKSTVALTMEKLDSPNGRVRANAVRSLLRAEVGRAGEVLLDMLEDSSRAHRLSALWVVGDLKLSTVRQRVNRISRQDRDERVRQSAKRVLQDLRTADAEGDERGGNGSKEQPVWDGVT